MTARHYRKPRRVTLPDGRTLTCKPNGTWWLSRSSVPGLQLRIGPTAARRLLLAAGITQTGE